MLRCTLQLQRIGWYFALSAVATDFIVSGNLLTNLGSAYISDGGVFLQKIHPGSYLAICSGCFAAASCIYRRRIFHMDAQLAICLSGVTISAVYAAATTGAGNVIVFIDTFLSAGMLALAAGEVNGRDRLQLRRIVQCLVVLNACIALGETVMQSHVIPVPNEAVENDREFRPTALYDHALTGAAVTMIGLWLAPRRPGMARLGYIILLAAALTAFGERAPLAMTSLAVLASILGRYTSVVRTRTLHIGHGVAILAVILALVAGAAALLSVGASSRLEAHLYWDESAQVRVNQFGILNALNPSELLFGCKRADLLALVEPLRLSSRVAVIENFWLFTFVALGAFGFVVFVFSLWALLKWLWRVSGFNGHVMIVLFMVVASASNSLGRKSTLLMTLVACVVASASSMTSARLNWTAGAAEP